MWDLSKGNLLRTLKGHSSWVVDAAVSPDACRAVTASHDGHVRYVWLWVVVGVEVWVFSGGWLG